MPNYVYLKGKVKNCRPHFVNKWNKYAAILYPCAESLEQIRDLQAEGIKNQLKKDEDGYYLWINRPASKEYQGRVKGFAPPEVLEADGKTPLRDVNIGNGSDVTMVMEVYGYNDPSSGKKGKAMRWTAVKVDNLVPWDGKRDFSEEEKERIQEVDKQEPYF